MFPSTALPNTPGYCRPQSLSGDPAISSSESVSATEPALFSYDGGSETGVFDPQDRNFTKANIYINDPDNCLLERQVRLMAVILGARDNHGIGRNRTPLSTIYHSLKVRVTISRARILSRLLKWSWSFSEEHLWRPTRLDVGLGQNRTRLETHKDYTYSARHPYHLSGAEPLEPGRHCNERYLGPDYWNQADIALKDICEKCLEETTSEPFTRILKSDYAVYGDPTEAPNVALSTAPLEDWQLTVDTAAAKVTGMTSILKQRKYQP
ncbi:hypothetical protein BU17DRAFT_62472 [Hysterangium stoloniferum]|nr:hypothetical protein BU17DRAFT_62472 [Hysterangium stoloniferum]